MNKINKGTLILFGVILIPSLYFLLWVVTPQFIIFIAAIFMALIFAALLAELISKAIKYIKEDKSK